MTASIQRNAKVHWLEFMLQALAIQGDIQFMRRISIVKVKHMSKFLSSLVLGADSGSNLTKCVNQL